MVLLYKKVNRNYNFSANRDKIILLFVGSVIIHNLYISYHIDDIASCCNKPFFICSVYNDILP